TWHVVENRHMPVALICAADITWPERREFGKPFVIHPLVLQRRVALAGLPRMRPFAEILRAATCRQDKRRRRPEAAPYDIGGRHGCADQVFDLVFQGRRNVSPLRLGFPAQLPRSSNSRRAMTLAWISAAPSKMLRMRASHKTRLIGYSSANPLPPWICSALSAAAQATRAASSLAMPASRSQRRPASFSRAAKYVSWRAIMISAAIMAILSATRGKLTIGWPN